MTDGGTPTQTLNGLDSVDGGAGRDTMNIDFGAPTVAAAFPGTATIKNVEVINVATSGNNGFNLDATSFTGLETLAVSNGGTGVSTVKGGATVSVTGGGAATVSGNALESVTLSKVSVNSTGFVAGTTPPTTSIAVNNTVAGGANTGTTLTAVTLDNIKDSAAVAGGVLAALNGDAIADVTVKNQSVNLAATITNAVSTSLKVNVDNAGYDAVGGTVAGVVVNAGAKAADITVNATGSKSNVTVNAAAAKTLTLTGDAALTLAGVSGAALTSIDGSAATGGLDLGTLNTGTAKVTTGSGGDKFQLSATKVTVDAGAGNDTVTIGAVIAAGSTVNLGAGDDVLQFASGSIAANTTTATTLIDGGDGVDSVAIGLVNAANAKQFVNFERIDASVGTTTLDVDLMTGSTIDGITLNGGTVAASNTVQNIAAGAGLTVAGTNTGSLTIGVKGAAAATDNVFDITFAGKAGASATATTLDTVSATAVGLADIETVNVASNGTGFVGNQLSLAANKALKTLNITGDKALKLSFTAQQGVDTPDATKGVSLIDGSTATGKLEITLTNINAVTGGLTVKGGSAGDVITTQVGLSSSLSGNGGNDSFVVTATTAGTGPATSLILAAAAKISTITDFTAGDKITGATAANAIAKVDIGTINNLDAAFDLLKAADAAVQWFNYGADTYVVYNDATDKLSGGDIVVKLAGVIDLSNATMAAGVLELA